MIERATPASSVILRAARISDVARLADIACASYHAAFSDILAPESLAKCDAGFFTLRFAREWGCVRLAEAEGRPCGFAMMMHKHISMLFVSLDCVGHGLGALLLADAEARGAKTLETFRDNRAARRFYERHGWLMERAYERAFLGHTYSFVLYAKP